MIHRYNSKYGKKEFSLSPNEFPVIGRNVRVNEFARGEEELERELLRNHRARLAITALGAGSAVGMCLRPEFAAGLAISGIALAGNMRNAEKLERRLNDLKPVPQ